MRRTPCHHLQIGKCNSDIPMKKAVIALVYDFDGTLSPGNMQEYDFIPDLGMKPEEFWNEVTHQAREISGDSILVYMGMMLKKANSAGVKVHRSNFVNYGAKLPLYPGVESWFDRINNYGLDRGIKIDHFIVSSGLREMIEGTIISQYFRSIFASSFWYDHNEVAHWPALALNYTTKTQYLFRINKGSLDIWDNEVINRYIPHQDRPIPFSNMIYFGDGETDIPCFRLVKDQGGHSIAINRPDHAHSEILSSKLISDNRINFSTIADYRKGSQLEKYVFAVIDNILSKSILNSFQLSVTNNNL